MESKTKQLPLPTFEERVKTAEKRGVLITKVPYKDRYRIHVTKRPSKGK
jgi:hypothetical protein